MSPAKALVSGVTIWTPAADLPRPSYSSGRSISGAVAAEVPGVTDIGPPLYAVSPWAVISCRFRLKVSSGENIRTDTDRSTVVSPGAIVATVSTARLLSLSRVRVIRVSVSSRAPEILLSNAGRTAS